MIFCQSCVLPCGWIGFLVLDVLSELLGIYVSHMIYQQGYFYFLSIYALIHFLILSLAIFFFGLNFSYYIELVKSGQSPLANLRENVF